MRHATPQIPLCKDVETSVPSRFTQHTSMNPLILHIAYGRYTTSYAYAPFLASLLAPYNQAGKTGTGAVVGHVTFFSFPAAMMNCPGSLSVHTIDTYGSKEVNHWSTMEDAAKEAS